MVGLREGLAMRLREAYFSIRRTAQTRLAASGATVDQVVVLTLISEEPGLSQRDIVERSFSDPSTIRAMLVLLEERGWVCREFDPGDARLRKVYLTPEGRKQQRRLKRIGHIGDPTNMENLFTDEELEGVEGPASTDHGHGDASQMERRVLREEGFRQGVVAPETWTQRRGRARVEVVPLLDSRT